MNYKENDYIYVIFFEYYNKKNNNIYPYTFHPCWCRVLSYDAATDEYDVITEYHTIQRKVPSSAINEKRTIQQGKIIRIKKLEPYYIWDK
jgi:hypothetical protein